MAADGAPSFVHLPLLAAAGETIEIAGDEAHYLTRVVRVRPGERVGATDGAGLLATLEVIACGASVEARVTERRTRTRPAELELWCGAPEGDRGDWLVEKLAELGVARLRLVDAERGRWERFAARRARWERHATAALRQSRAAWRLAIETPAPLAVVLADAGAAAARWVCRPDGEPTAGRVGATPGRTIAAVGPSSGFSGAELNALQDGGFAGLSLAAVRLRTETAALAVAALWAAGTARPDARAAGGAGGA